MLSKSNVLILCVAWLQHLWEVYILLRQLNILKVSQVVPDELAHQIDPNNFSLTRRLARAKYRQSLFKNGYDQIILTLFVVLGIFKWIWTTSGAITQKFGLQNGNSQSSQGAIYMLLLNLIQLSLDLPFVAYQACYSIEDGCFKFSVPAIGHHLGQHIMVFLFEQKTFLFQLFMMTRAVESYKSNLFIKLVFLGCSCLILSAVYFTFVLSNTFIPLPEGDLKQSIEMLARHVGFPTHRIFMHSGSAPPNAFSFGSSKFPGIVVTQSLIEGVGFGPNTFTKNEILAIVGHELGHWKKGHFVKNVVITALATVPISAIFSLIYQSQNFFQGLGLGEERPIAIATLITGIITTSPVIFFKNFMSWRFEHQADSYAKSLNLGQDLKSALIKLKARHFYIQDWLFALTVQDHPPLLQRVRNLDTW